MRRTSVIGAAGEMPSVVLDSDAIDENFDEDAPEVEEGALVEIEKHEAPGQNPGKILVGAWKKLQFWKKQPVNVVRDAGAAAVAGLQLPEISPVTVVDVIAKLPVSAEVRAAMETFIKGTETETAINQAISHVIVNIYPQLQAAFSTFLNGDGGQTLMLLAVTHYMAMDIYRKESELPNAVNELTKQSYSTVKAMSSTTKLYRSVEAKCFKHSASLPSRVGERVFGFFARVATLAKDFVSGEKDPSAALPVIKFSVLAGEKYGSAEKLWNDGFRLKNDDSLTPKLFSQRIRSSLGLLEGQAIFADLFPKQTAVDKTAFVKTIAPILTDTTATLQKASQATPRVRAVATEAETDACKEQREGVQEALDKVYQGIMDYKELWSTADGSIEEFSTLAFYSLHGDITWKARCCPGGSCAVRNGGQSGLEASSAPADASDEAWKRIIDADVFLTEAQKADETTTVFTSVEARLEAYRTKLVAYAESCPASIHNLFVIDGQQEAFEVARCITDADSQQTLTNAMQVWGAKTVMDQAERMENRWNSVVCPTLAASAVAIIGQGNQIYAADGNAKELASGLLASYFADGCASDAREGLALTCESGSVDVVVSPAFQKSVGDASVAELREQFRKGKSVLAVDEEAQSTDCWDPEAPGDYAAAVVMKRARSVQKWWKKIQDDFFGGTTDAVKDLAAIATLLGAGVIGASAPLLSAGGLSAKVMSTMWLAYRTFTVTVGQMDIGEDCIEAAFLMRGASTTRCDVLIEEAFLKYRQANRNAAADLQQFVSAVLEKKVQASQEVLTCLQGPAPERASEPASPEEPEQVQDQDWD